MKHLRYTILPVFVAGIWVNASEFVRNEIIAKPYWVEHYTKMGLAFPSRPVNAVVWMAWGFSFAVLIFILSKRYSLLHTTLFSWFASFFMMWLVAWNLAVLPPGILWIAGPLSLLEAFIGAWIIKKMAIE